MCFRYSREARVAGVERTGIKLWVMKSERQVFRVEYKSYTVLGHCKDFDFYMVITRVILDREVT